MKDYAYIKKVLSHINSKRKQEEIRLELFDHMDERSSFYEDIGFTEEQADEKAELAMGDGDIVGEQFGARVNGLKGRKFAYYAADFAAFVLYVLNFLAYDSLFIYESSSICISEFLIFILSAISFSASLVCLVIGTKKKDMLSLISGTVFSLLAASRIADFACKAVTYKSSFAESFYNGWFRSPAESSYVKFAVIIFILSVFFNGVVVYIKTKKLENTMLDIKKNNVISVILVMIISCTVLLAAATTGRVVSIRDAQTYEAAKRSQTACSEFISNAEEFVTPYSVEIDMAMEKSFIQSSYSAYHLYTYAYDENADTRNYSVSASADGNFNCLEIQETLMNPFCVSRENIRGDYLHKLSSDEVFSSMKLKDAPLPAEITLTNNEGVCIVLFNYDKQCYSLSDSSSSYIRFIFNEDKKCFEFLDSSELEYGKSITLTKKQMQSLNKAIAEYPQFYMENYDGIASVVYDAAKCEDKDIYKLSISYCGYNTKKDNGKIKVVNRDVTWVSSMFVRINKNSVEILQFQDEREYNEEMAKALFTERGYKQFIKKDMKWLTEVIKG